MLKHFDELDSLRGIAALSVVIDHFIMIFPNIALDTYDTGINPVNVIKYSPLHVFWAGTEAVVLFFLLSGLVLSLPFINGKTQTYPSFMTKRFFRIYPAYICAVLLGMVMRSLLYHGKINELSSWFNSVWTNPFSFHALLDHVLLIVSFPNGNFVPVLWSLVHEMRISILFPLLMIMIIKFNSKQNIIIGLILSLSGFILTILFNISNDYVLSLQFIIMFITGALIAKHMSYLVERYSSLPRAIKFIIFIFGICLYTFKWNLHYIPVNKSVLFLKMYNVLSLDFIKYWAMTVGASIFIIASLSAGTFSRILRQGIPRYLGKISYSLYLFHSIVLMSFIHILYGIISIWAILLIAFVVSLILATISYYFIEKPFIGLGKKAANILLNKKSL